MEEIWKDIKGYEGIYKVSNLGRVSSTLRNSILKPQINEHGYERIGLRKPGCRKFEYIHRLVASSFLENLENKPQVNHVDGNPLNNSLSNLEWVTQDENAQHASKFKLLNTKITEEVVNEIRSLNKDEFSTRDLAAKYNISQSQVVKILNFKQRKYV